MRADLRAADGRDQRDTVGFWLCRRLVRGGSISRRFIIVALGALVIATVVAGLARTGSGGDRSPTSAETQDGEESSTGVGTLDGTQGRLHREAQEGSTGDFPTPDDSMAGGDASSEAFSTPEDASALALTASGVAVGLLHEGLLLDASFEYLAGLADTKNEQFEARRASPFVGAALVTARYKGAVVLATTNHAELVRVRSDWETVDTLLPVGSPGDDEKDLPYVGYGSLVVDGDELLASYRFGETVGISRIDLRSWTLVESVTFPGRFAAFPQACRIRDGLLAMVTSRGLSYVEMQSLGEQQFVPIDGAPTAVACVEGEVWISDLNVSQGGIYDDVGDRVGSFSWTGDGSSRLVYSAEQGAVFGTDPVVGAVFSCRTVDRRCTQASSGGEKPTDVLVHGETLYVTNETSASLGLLNAQDLLLRGTVSLPGPVRTLTLT